MSKLFGFGEALEYLRQGKRVYRVNWSNTSNWLRLEYASMRGDKICKDYIEIKTNQNYYVPWVASHTDLLSKDWSLVN